MNTNKDISKDKKENTKDTAAKESRTRILFIVLAVIVAASLITYFILVNFVGPGFLNIKSSSYGSNKNSDITEEINNNGSDAGNIAEDYSNYFVVPKVSTWLASEDTGTKTFKELKINSEPGTGNFSFSNNIDAGSEIRFNIVISHGTGFKAGNFQATLTLQDSLENIKLLEDKQGITFDPFSKKIILNKEILNSAKDITLSFTAVASKEAENGQEFHCNININSGEEQVLQSVISGSINAIADLSRSSMTAKDLNGGSLWAKEVISYEIKLVNSGKGTSRELMVKCPVPSSTGLVQGSVEPQDYTLSPDKSSIEYNIGRLKPGQVVVLNYRVFTADYLTYRSSIKSGFTVTEKNTAKELLKAEAPEIYTEQFSYQTIVCMGDSQIVVTEWPLILDELLETQYAHAEFNTILSGVRGEMATNAISRFDSAVRPYKPDIIILGYGSNDAGEEPAFFRYHMGILIQQALSTGARVFVHGIGYIDLTNHLWSEKSNYPLFDKMLQEEICPMYGVEYVDIYKLFQEDPDKYMSKDGIHWSEEGANLVAHEVFKSIVKNLDPDGKLKPETISGES